MMIITPVEGELYEESFEIGALMDRFAYVDSLRPDIPNDVKAASGCAGCSACSGCVLCLADGPIPDFEVAGLIGLGGLWGLAGSFATPQLPNQ